MLDQIRTVDKVRLVKKVGENKYRISKRSAEGIDGNVFRISLEETHTIVFVKTFANYELAKVLVSICGDK